MKKRLLILATAVVAAIATGGYFLKPVSGPDRDLTLVGDVARGNYLIRLGGCVACHTDIKADGAFLAGGAGLETAFGTFVAPNITSDPTAGIGAWTIQQFSDAMSNGVGPKGRLYPVFPYENYTLMSDQEIADLYAALMATEPVSTPSAENVLSFPFNVRLAMAGWQNLFFRPGRHEADENKSDAYNRGRYLAFGPGHCVSCHTPRNALGAMDWNAALTGSPGGTGGRAPDITAAGLAAEGYDVETLVQTLKDGFTPGFDVLGGAMGEVITESTVHWTDEDLTDLATFLLED